MKKVGLITFYSSHNYGAMLQAYALQKTLSNLGTDCKIIQYRTPKMINDYAVLKKGKNPRIIVKNALNLFRYRAFAKKHKRFEQFICENFLLTKRYTSLAQLLSEPPQMDMYITGSDQVWNGSTPIKDAYFLPFAEKNAKRISYAASFGDSLPKEKYEQRIEMYLKNFDKISVREDSAKHYLEEKFGLNVEQMPDPVFLLSKKQWGTFLVANKEKKPYIFCYCLSKASHIQEVVNEVKRKTGLKVVTLSDAMTPNIKADKVYYNVGPKEFLTLLHDAAFVVTDSFHGTAFSLLFEKQFISVARETRSKRIDSLLQQFFLSERFVASPAEIVWQNVEYQGKTKLFLNLSDRGITYLKGCMDEE